jgi:hypothetical protein
LPCGIVEGQWIVPDVGVTVQALRIAIVVGAVIGVRLEPTPSAGPIFPILSMVGQARISTPKSDKTTIAVVLRAKCVCR